MTNQITFYNKSPMLSYRMYFNMITGNRSCGKTFAFKRWCIDDYLKTGRMFAWVRRYGTEIKALRGTQKTENNDSFWGDIEEYYQGHKLGMQGDNKKGTILIDGKAAGCYFALNTSSSVKSVPYPKIDKIIFDEFLIMGNTYHYLDKEVDIFMELVYTIFRLRELMPDAVKPRGIYLIANNITIANPYYLYFNVKPFQGEFYIDKERGLLCQQYKSAAFVEQVEATRFGKLIKGTTYADYALENKGYLDNDKFIAKRPPHCNFNCAIDYKGRTYGFWLDYKYGNMYVDYRYDPDSPCHYSLTRDDHSINTFLVKNSNYTDIKNIIWLFRNGCMFFDNVQLKNQVYELLAYFVK